MMTRCWGCRQTSACVLQDHKIPRQNLQDAGNATAYLKPTVSRMRRRDIRNPNKTYRMGQMTKISLALETTNYRGTGGVSENNRGLGFQPAFIDRQSGTVHLSRFPDGRRQRF